MHVPLCDDRQIERLISDELTPDERLAAESHLDSCETCRLRLDHLAAAPELWTEIRTRLTNFSTETDPALHDLGFVPTRIDTRIVRSWLSATDDPEMIGRLGPYEIQGIIGSGGMGVVLKGWDRALRRFVAIKMLAPHLASGDAARQRFLRESRAAAAVVHENVVAIHGVAEVDGLPYFVMPYSRGESLQKRLDRVGALSVTEILRISLQTARGLAAAHAQGLVHRDVKPANILLDEGVERVLLTDFGLARAVDDATLTRSGVIAGTPQYMSPEQIRAEGVDTRSDLFSLGATIYAMCTGRAPFRAESTYAILRQITDEEAPALADMNPAIPDWLSRIVSRLMSKDPSRRFSSVRELAELLEACLANLERSPEMPLSESRFGNFGIVFETYTSADSSEATLVELSSNGPTEAPGGRLRRLALSKGGIAMGILTILTMATIGFLVGTEPPDLSGLWRGEDWGTVKLEAKGPGTLEGTFDDTVNGQPGKLKLQWSRVERRYFGEWREGDDRFGTISIRIDGDAIRGAMTTDAASKINPATPRLADLTWNKLPSRVPVSVAQSKPQAQTKKPPVRNPFPQPVVDMNDLAVVHEFTIPKEDFPILIETYAVETNRLVLNLSKLEIADLEKRSKPLMLIFEITDEIKWQKSVPASRFDSEAVRSSKAKEKFDYMQLERLNDGNVIARCLTHKKTDRNKSDSESEKDRTSTTTANSGYVDLQGEWVVVKDSHLGLPPKLQTTFSWSMKSIKITGNNAKIEFRNEAADETRCELTEFPHYQMFRHTSGNLHGCLYTGTSDRMIHCFGKGEIQELHIYQDWSPGGNRSNRTVVLRKAQPGLRNEVTKAEPDEGGQWLKRSGFDTKRLWTNTYYQLMLSDFSPAMIIPETGEIDSDNVEVVSVDDLTLSKNTEVELPSGTRKLSWRKIGRSGSLGLRFGNVVYSKLLFGRIAENWIQIAAEFREDGSQSSPDTNHFPSSTRNTTDFSRPNEGNSSPIQGKPSADQPIGQNLVHPLKVDAFPSRDLGNGPRSEGANHPTRKKRDPSGYATLQGEWLVVKDSRVDDRSSKIRPEKIRIDGDQLTYVFRDLRTDEDSTVSVRMQYYDERRHLSGIIDGYIYGQSGGNVIACFGQDKISDIFIDGSWLTGDPERSVLLRRIKPGDERPVVTKLLDSDRDQWGKTLRKAYDQIAKGKSELFEIVPGDILPLTARFMYSESYGSPFDDLLIEEASIRDAFLKTLSKPTGIIQWRNRSGGGRFGRPIGDYLYTTFEIERVSDRFLQIGLEYVGDYYSRSRNASRSPRLDASNRGVAGGKSELMKRPSNATSDERGMMPGTPGMMGGMPGMMPQGMGMMNGKPDRQQTMDGRANDMMGGMSGMGGMMGMPAQQSMDRMVGGMMGTMPGMDGMMPGMQPGMLIPEPEISSKDNANRLDPGHLAKDSLRDVAAAPRPTDLGNHPGMSVAPRGYAALQGEWVVVKDSEQGLAEGIVGLSRLDSINIDGKVITLRSIQEGKKGLSTKKFTGNPFLVTHFESGLSFGTIRLDRSNCRIEYFATGAEAELCIRGNPFGGGANHANQTVMFRKLNTRTRPAIVKGAGTEHERWSALVREESSKSGKNHMGYYDIIPAKQLPFEISSSVDPVGNLAKWSREILVDEGRLAKPIEINLPASIRVIRWQHSLTARTLGGMHIECGDSDLRIERVSNDWIQISLTFRTEPRPEKERPADSVETSANSNFRAIQPIDPVSDPRPAEPHNAMDEPRRSQHSKGVTIIPVFLPDKIIQDISKPQDVKDPAIDRASTFVSTAFSRSRRTVSEQDLAAAIDEVSRLLGDGKAVRTEPGERANSWPIVPLGPNDSRAFRWDAWFDPENNRVGMRRSSDGDPDVSAVYQLEPGHALVVPWLFGADEHYARTAYRSRFCGEPFLIVIPGDSKPNLWPVSKPDVLDQLEVRPVPKTYDEIMNSTGWNDHVIVHELVFQASRLPFGLEYRFFENGVETIRKPRVGRTALLGGYFLDIEPKTEMTLIGSKGEKIVIGGSNLPRPFTRVRFDLMGKDAVFVSCWAPREPAESAVSPKGAQPAESDSK